jgi:hypothetical protein
MEYLDRCSSGVCREGGDMIVSNNPDWISNLIVLAAALLGAVVGSLVSGGVTWLQARRAKAELDEARAIEITVKAGMIASGLHKIADRCEPYFGMLDDEEPRSRIWALMPPQWFAPYEGRITADDVALFHAAKLHQLGYDLLYLDEKHQHLLRMIAFYNSRRVELGDRFGAHIEPGTDKGPPAVDAENFRLAAPRIVELAQLAPQIVFTARAYREEANRVSGLIGPALRSKFKGLRGSGDMKFVPGRQLWPIPDDAAEAESVERPADGGAGPKAPTSVPTATQAAAATADDG